MSTEPLEEVYFKWLAVQVVNVRQSGKTRTYWHILRQLHQTEFVWKIRNDDNRVEDGKELRIEFLDRHPEEQFTREWLESGCSFLEMLIALSRRFAFQVSGFSSAECFWLMLSNIQLQLTDATYEEYRAHDYVAQILERVNNRTYDANGRGGLFPLNDSPVDLRQVELWYQLNYYLLESN